MAFGFEPYHVILLSIGGLALSATTLMPTWRRLARHARHGWKVATASVPSFRDVRVAKPRPEEEGSM